MSASLGHRYVTSDARILGGEPIIAGTRTPVRAIVELYRNGLAAEEIATRLPHLRLAQVFDALRYFDDHRDEITGYIERNGAPDNRAIRISTEESIRPPLVQGKLLLFPDKIQVAEWACAEDQVSRDRE